eukprot:7249689-Pyramimonas_sp.AAC.1
MVVSVMVVVAMMIHMMNVRAIRRKQKEYRKVRRITWSRLVYVRGVRAHRYPLWTFGELAYITIDRDDAARPYTALRFHPLPFHVRKGG